MTVVSSTTDRIARAQLARVLEAAHEMSVRLASAGNLLAEIGARANERWLTDQLPRREQLQRARMALGEAAEAINDYQRALAGSPAAEGHL